MNPRAGLSLIIQIITLIFATQFRESSAIEPVTRKSFEYGKEFLLKCTNEQQARTRTNDSILTKGAAAEIMWRKDGKELQSTNISYDIILTNGNTTSRVSKSNLTQEDEGIYECVINRTIYKTFKVFVHSKVVILAHKQLKMNLGGKLELICTGTGDQELEWMVPYEDINRTSVVNAQNRSESMLTITQFEHNDVGLYTCIGRRLLGDEYEEASDSVNVILVDPVGTGFPDNIWPWLVLGISAVVISGCITGFVYYRKSRKMRENHGASYLRSETSS